MSGTWKRHPVPKAAISGKIARSTLKVKNKNKKRWIPIVIQAIDCPNYLHMGLVS